MKSPFGITQKDLEALIIDRFPNAPKAARIPGRYDHSVLDSSVSGLAAVSRFMGDGFIDLSEALNTSELLPFGYAIDYVKTRHSFPVMPAGQNDWLRSFFKYAWTVTYRSHDIPIGRLFNSVQEYEARKFHLNSFGERIMKVGPETAFLAMQYVVWGAGYERISVRRQTDDTGGNKALLARCASEILAERYGTISRAAAASSR